MTIETDDLDSFSDISEYLSWALETGIWNGRQVSWLEASEFRDQAFIRIFDLLSKSPSSERLAAHLAWVGTPASLQSLLARDIQELNFCKSDLILQAGLKKSCSKFWKKHKKEILIGAAIVAVVTVVIVIAVSTSGAGASAAAAAGSSALEALNAKNQPTTPSPPQIAQPPEPSPPDLTQVNFGEKGIVFNGEYTSYEDILLNKTDTPSFPFDPSLHPNQPKPWVANFLDIIGRGIIDSPDLLDPNIPLPSHELSSPFFTLGERQPWLGLSGINGINTTKEEAIDHANHLAKYAPGHCVDWVYNQSHGPVIDTFEVITMNLPGVSPNTSDLLLENWTAFHKANINNPKAKFLQFCHSQGAIHVRNTLTNAPQEIRDRVIVQAFGPAAIIPDEVCFRAYHYACKGDLIPLAEVAFAISIGNTMNVRPVLENHKKIIWVDPHPDTKSPHDFQNPAFDKIKQDAIDIYLKNKGVY